MSIDPHQARRAHAGRRVDPHLVFGISLLVALVVSWPSLDGAMHGQIDIVQAGAHLLVAMAISWAGCYFVGSLMYGYAQTVNTTPSEPAPAEGTPQRRASDALPIAAPTDDTEVVDAA